MQASNLKDKRSPKACIDNCIIMVFNAKYTIAKGLN